MIEFDNYINQSPIRDFYLQKVKNLHYHHLMRKNFMKVNFGSEI